MVAYEKIYFALRKVDLRWSLFRDAPDIHKFVTVHMVKTTSC